MRRKFYFNTGVQPAKLVNYHMMKGTELSRNGVVIIPFECNNVPENAVFLYASDFKESAKGRKSVIIRKIYNSTLVSKYAFFHVNKPVKG